MGEILSSDVGRVAFVAAAMSTVAVVGLLLVMLRQQRLLRQYRRLLVGSSGGNLEALLNEHADLVRETASSARSLDRRVGCLEEASALDLQHLAVLRYNPFHDTGGDQSFALALADGRGNGVILSSLHARDTTRVYAKPLERWESAHSLTREEQEAIALARGTL